MIKNIFKDVKLMVLTSVIVLFALAIVSYPSILPVVGANTSSFSVSLTIDNSVPTVTAVAPVSDSPDDGTTKIVSFHFNASDDNGISDIPASNAAVTINQSGTERTSSTCWIYGSSGITAYYECNITINYYDLPGAWTINASVHDGASAQDDNLTEDFTMGTTYGIDLTKATLSFSGSPGENDVNASNNPQIINNTGNGEFSELALTAFDLVGGTSLIDPGNFTANTTDTANGHTMINNSAVTLGDSAVSVLGTQNIFVYIDIPTGVDNETYNSVSNWVVTAS